jgi:hypothetical protein
MKRIRGSVQIHTSSSSDNEQPVLQIPFRATVLHGSLDYDKESSYFYIPSSSVEASNEKREECQAVKLMNRFNVSMVIYNITTSNMELFSRYVKVKYKSKIF